MRTLALAFALSALGALALSGTAGALLTPGRTVTNAAPVTALSVTGRSVAYAVGRTTKSCGTVRLWDTGTRGVWTFGNRTIVGCDENPSGGFGIASVATTGRRVFWLTHIGGNITDYQLWTATRTRTAARRLAFASSDSDGPAAIVLGNGTRDGVPYAVGGTVTLVAESGARVFRTDLGSPVRLLAAGTGPGQGRVEAALADGRVVTLSRAGQVLATDTQEPGAVTALALALPGPVVQVGPTVTVGSSTVTLPAGGLMLDYRQGTVVYRKGTQVRARVVSTGADTLLQVIVLRPWQPLHFSTDSFGSAWARGSHGQLALRPALIAARRRRPRSIRSRERPSRRRRRDARRRGARDPARRRASARRRSSRSVPVRPMRARPRHHRGRR